MKRKDIKVRINMKLWEKVKERIMLHFGKEYSEVDCLLIISLLYLYKHPKHDPDTIYLVAENPSDLSEENYKSKTISVFTNIMDKIKEHCPNCTNSNIIEILIVSYLYQETSVYTDKISPIYTFVGSKNQKMQSATSNAIRQMQLDYQNTTLIDGCVGTGSLFLGLDTYDWKNVILNDLNPKRTNFLNVIKLKGLTFIKYFLDNDVWTYITDKNLTDDTYRLNYKKTLKKSLDEYKNSREKHHKIDCNVEMAFMTLLYHCMEGKYVKNSNDIFNNILKILPACIKLKNARITQEDCLKYLENDDSNKFVILDVPYVGTEEQCGIEDYDYERFHKKVAEKLYTANYSFLYFCRSSAPKSDKSRPDKELEKIMKMKLGTYFWNKGFYFEKIYLDNGNVTELMISNQQYDNEKQFEWIDFDTDILN